MPHLVQACVNTLLTIHTPSSHSNAWSALIRKRIACSVELGRAADVLSDWRALFDAGEREDDILFALAAAYEADGDWYELADVLRAMAAQKEGGARGLILLRLARLLATQCDELFGADGGWAGGCPP